MIAAEENRIPTTTRPPARDWIAKYTIDKINRLEPNEKTAHLWLAVVYLDKKMYEQAIREAQRSLVLSPCFRTKGILGYAYGVSGRIEDATKILDEMLQASMTQYVSYQDLAFVYTGLGKYEEALDLLEKAHNERSEILPYILNGNWFAPLRSFEASFNGRWPCSPRTL